MVAVGPTGLQSPGARRPRILVVDDDADVRNAIGTLLEDEGFEVSLCGDGRRAWELLHAGPLPDLLILDLMLPGMDGWQLRTQQRADPDLQHIPVLAISADGSAKAAAIHANAFLAKPVSAENLLHAVERILSEQSTGGAADNVARLHRLALLGALTSNVEHELRNPLAFLLTNARLAFDSLPELRAQVPAAAMDVTRGFQELAAMLEDTRLGAERIHAIVEAMGWLARHGSEQRSRVLLDEVMHTVERLAGGHLRRRLRLNRQGSGPAVMADERQLVQIFVSLVLVVGDHLRARPAESEVEISLRREHDQAVVELVARSTGTPRPRLEHGGGDVGVTRAQPARPSASWEEGLHLSICRALLARASGTLHAEPSVDGGVDYVRVLLPVASDAAC